MPWLSVVEEMEFKKMNRRELFKTAAAGLAMGLPAPGTGRSRAKCPSRPNLLFLITDQQRTDTLRAYGNTRNIAPNLDRLADKSVVFKQYYVTQPLCTPSRGCLFSGLYPHTNGATANNIPIRADVPVLTQMLQEGNYATAYYGKWHLGNEICKQHGFDYFESTQDENIKYVTGPCGGRKHSGYYDFLIRHGIKLKHGVSLREFSNELPKELSKPAYLADTAEDFLAKHGQKPWAMYVSFIDPHTPYHSVNDHLYNPSSMPVPKSFSEKPDPTELDRYKAIRQLLLRGYQEYQGMIASPETLQQVEARYWGKVTLVDEMIGRILKRLEDLGLDDKTIIVFTSDHGAMMGDHRLMFKSVMYEQAVKVPMLLRVPWLANSSLRIIRPVSEVDVTPTLLELMAQPLPRHLQGQSWAPYLTESREVPERDVIIEFNGPPWPFKDKYTEPLRTIRTTEGWKMTLAPQGAGLLYHLTSDPEEMTNLFYREDSLPVIHRLAARINLWQQATGDKLIRFDEEGWQIRREEYIRQGAVQARS